MTSGSLELLKLNRLIHDPGRLLILTFLYPVAKLDYLELKKRIRFSAGNLSSHLAKLEKAGYVAIENGRRFIGCELKRSYFEAACRNIDRASSIQTLGLFDAVAVG